MTPRLATLVVALSLAACSKNTSILGAKLASPSGVALAYARTAKAPDTRLYVAVAAARGDELRFIDTTDDQVVRAPALIGPLSIPTDPRPASVASSSLHDGNVAAPTPDLLVVASTGLVEQAVGSGSYLARLQVVDTWSGEPTVAFEVDLDGDALGESVLGLLALPVPASTTLAGRVYPATGGQARLLVLLTGNKLAVVDFERYVLTSAGGVQYQAVRRSSAPITVQVLPFTPNDLTLSPDQGFVYASSTTPIPLNGVSGPTVFGIAEINALGPVGAFPISGINTIAPTTHVTAALQRDFLRVRDGVGTDGTDRAYDVFDAVPSTFIYASLDETRCGREAPIPCGVAAVNQATHALADDPAGELPYRLPIYVPGHVVGLFSPPVPLVATATPRPATYPNTVELDPGGQRWTTSVGLAASSDGGLYLLDYGHMAPLNGATMLRSASPSVPTGTRVVAVGSLAAPTALGNTPLLGVWSSIPGLNVVTGAHATVNAILVTPGFTGSEIWNVTWQGVLPFLLERRGALNLASAGPSTLALQASIGSVKRDVVRVYDPRFGIRFHRIDVGSLTIPSDIVVVGPDTGDVGYGKCPGPFELEVTDILPPDPGHPGGSLAVTPAAVQPQVPVWNADGSQQAVTQAADPHCLDDLADPDHPATVTIRAAGMVLVGSLTGYAGRPPMAVSSTNTSSTEGEYLFQFQDERQPGLTCPLADFDWDSGASPPACNATCRQACDALVLARKARRFVYVLDQCRSTDTTASCQDLWAWRPLDFPNALGPVLEFNLGLVYAKDAHGVPVGNPGDPVKDLLRGAGLAFTTDSGVAPVAWRPMSGSIRTAAELPAGMAYYDKTALTGNGADAVHMYAAYPGGLVMDFTVNAAVQNQYLIR